VKEFGFSDPRAFVLPSGIEPFLSAFGAYRSRGEQVVERHLGIAELDMRPDRRYSLGGFMAAMRELQDQLGPAFLRRMGFHIVGSTHFPPELDSLGKVLSTLDQRYLMNHDPGGVEIGHYRWAGEDARSGSMTCDTPYACAMDTGLLESVLARFEPETGRLVHAEGPCRHKGDEVCVYRLAW
jgi:hypothetical protein